MTDKIDSVLTGRVRGSSLIEKGNKQLKHYSWKKMAQETLERI